MSCAARSGASPRVHIFLRSGRCVLVALGVGQYQRRNHAVDSVRTCPRWTHPEQRYLFNILLLLARRSSCTSSSPCASVCAATGSSSSRCSRQLCLYYDENCCQRISSTGADSAARTFGLQYVTASSACTLIISLWVTQTLAVFQLVYKQCTMEVLFVDWEPARAPDPQNPFPVSGAPARSIFVANVGRTPDDET